ncbi:ankyrin repeat domain-containing protein [Streptomyces oceani]|uniref:ankyrin repeat domain-containing protein n=1 Tax=Streptomyces oceani TaxID=1075402 RepID=UPI00147A1E1B|nr:ankyrin repeat domain-containing protein [Streptomyces oceani]
MHEAVRRGDLREVRDRVESDHSLLHGTDTYGDTALHHAYRDERFDMADLLLELGAEPSLTNNRRESPERIFAALRHGTARRLFDEAAASDHPQVGQFGVDEPDALGWTALHLAYYHGHEDAAERLIALGADADVRNTYGLKPHRMRELAKTESRLLELAALLRHDYTGSASWTDPETASRHCRWLRNQQHAMYSLALWRAVKQSVPRTRSLLGVAIRLGVAESLPVMASLLHDFGNKRIATDYLNCGATELERAAKGWALAHGYTVTYSNGVSGARWGSA